MKISADDNEILTLKDACVSLETAADILTDVLNKLLTNSGLDEILAISHQTKKLNVCEMNMLTRLRIARSIIKQHEKEDEEPECVD